MMVRGMRHGYQSLDERPADVRDRRDVSLPTPSREPACKLSEPQDLIEVMDWVSSPVT